MYISRVEIDTANRKKNKDLAHAGAYHNWVECCFPSDIRKNNRNRKLWRIDRINQKNYLIVVSRDKPDPELLERYGVEGSAQTKCYDNFLDSLRENLKMRFRVVLNPVISLSRGTGNKSVVKPHVTIDHQMKYLMERSEKNGFTLCEDEFSITERGYMTLKKTNQRTIRLVKAEYEGLLTITDISVFINVLTNGLGKHKAYGFGMMTVIPIVD